MTLRASVRFAESNVFATIATAAIDWHGRGTESATLVRTSRLLLPAHCVPNESPLRDWNGALLALDGPFIETKEFVLG